MADKILAAIIQNPAVELHVVQTQGAERGLLELDFRSAGECELAFFGLVGSLRGKGVGRWLMNRAIERAWSRPIRFWVHTCTLDHPDALAFYIRSGLALAATLLLQAFYTVRTKRQLMEQIDFNLLFCWFVGLSVDDPMWDATVYRLLDGDIARNSWPAS